MTAASEHTSTMAYVRSWFQGLERAGGTVGDGPTRSFDAGLTLAARLRSSYGTAIVDHQPGNGTRYVLVVTDLTRVMSGEDSEPTAREVLGGRYLASLPLNRDGRTMVLPVFAPVTPDYVASSLTMNVADATHVAALLTWFLAFADDYEMED